MKKLSLLQNHTGDNQIQFVNLLNHCSLKTKGKHVEKVRTFADYP